MVVFGLANLNKCPRCKNRQVVIEKFKNNLNEIVATKISCRKCGKVKYEEIRNQIITKDWKSSSENKIKVKFGFKIKMWILKLKEKKK